MELKKFESELNFVQCKCVETGWELLSFRAVNMTPVF